VQLVERNAGHLGAEELLQLLQRLLLHRSPFRRYLDPGDPPIGRRRCPPQQASGHQLVDIRGDGARQHIEIFTQCAGTVDPGMHQEDDAQRTFRDRMITSYGHGEHRNEPLYVHHRAEKIDDVGIVGCPMASLTTAKIPPRPCVAAHRIDAAI
jgi:hypothetical protein